MLKIRCSFGAANPAVRRTLRRRISTAAIPDGYTMLLADGGTLLADGGTKYGATDELGYAAVDG
jgi:hypothetical protein